MMNPLKTLSTILQKIHRVSEQLHQLQLRIDFIEERGAGLERRVEAVSSEVQHGRDQVLQATQALDGNMVRGLESVVGMASRLESGMSGVSQRVEAVSSEVQHGRDQVLQATQALDGNMVRGLESVVAGLGRLDADVGTGFTTTTSAIWSASERVTVGVCSALHQADTVDPLTNPGLAIRLGLQKIIDGVDQRVESITLPHPFSNMTREHWADAINLWLSHSDSLLAGCAPRGCPACRHDQGISIFKSYDGYPYSECPKCGTWYVPVAVDQNLFERYFSVCPDGRPLADYMITQDSDATVVAADRARFFGYYTELIKKLPMDRPRAVDIGCSVGTSLDVAAELGFHAVGVEVNGAARSIASSRGRAVYANLADIPRGKFDLITSWESLEHMSDVDAIMDFAKKRLTRHGRLAFTVPNLNSPIIRSMRADSMYINGGAGFAGHVNLFSPQSITTLLNRFGFDTVKVSGQYSMNLNEVAAYHSGKWRGARDYLTGTSPQVELPSSLVNLLSAVGPAVAAWEASCAMAPILYVVAGRQSSRFT